MSQDFVRIIALTLAIALGLTMQSHGIQPGTGHTTHVAQDKVAAPKAES